MSRANNPAEVDSAGKLACALGLDTRSLILTRDFPQHHLEKVALPPSRHYCEGMPLARAYQWHNTKGEPAKLVLRYENGQGAKLIRQVFFGDDGQLHHKETEERKRLTLPYRFFETLERIRLQVHTKGKALFGIAEGEKDADQANRQNVATFTTGAAGSKLEALPLAALQHLAQSNAIDGRLQCVLFEDADPPGRAFVERIRDQLEDALGASLAEIKRLPSDSLFDTPKKKGEHNESHSP